MICSSVTGPRNLGTTGATQVESLQDTVKGALLLFSFKCTYESVSEVSSEHNTFVGYVIGFYYKQHESTHKPKCKVIWGNL